MLIIPKLNLNKHPKDITIGSLSDAINMNINVDSTLLCTENSIINKGDVYERICNIISKPTNNLVKIIFAIPCNKEIVFFVQSYSDNILDIIRYNEELDELYLCCTTDYDGGEFTGTFTYNQEHLIISFSEFSYDNKLNKPLKVLDLNKFGEEAIASDIYKQPICPEVHIPKVTTELTNGNAYKGWYYIFIRYKISKNNYTQWFNTNESIFIDTNVTEYIEDYYLSKENNPIANEVKNNYNRFICDRIISDSKEIANTTFKCTINHVLMNDGRHEYIEFQLGFINVRKDTNKCWRTNDLSNNVFTFNLNEIVEYSVIDMVTTYVNYYNVKTIDTYKNTLYIANYIDNYKEAKIISDDLTVTLDSFESPVDEDKYQQTTGDRTNKADLLNQVFYKYDYFITKEIVNNPNEYFNFFIHFVDKYGNATRGFNLSEFKLNYSGTKVYNKLHNILVNSGCVKWKIKLNKLPEGFIGYYVSYEKLEVLNKHYGFLLCNENTKDYEFYSDKLNVDDTISFNFNKCSLSDFTKAITTIHANVKPTYVGEFNITDKQLKVADTYSNILKATNIRINIAEKFKEDKDFKFYLCKLYNNDPALLYNSQTKILIPCTQVCYNVTNNIDIKTNTGFYTQCNAIIQKDLFIYNNTIKAFQNSFNIKNGKIDPIDRVVGNVSKPFHNVWYRYYDTIPTTSWQINDAPQVVVFPINGLNTEKENEKGFAVGRITELKDTVDLFQQKNPTYYDMYPKPNFNFNRDNHITDTFNRTIRRSNPIQDESISLNWRKFNTDNYKNIIENKGDIIKLIPIGSTFLVHTQHSLFQFDVNTNLQTNNVGAVEIGNNDVWDINYKEVFTSTLGFAGISHINHSIVGNFGYIFFDSDNIKLYRYDSGKLSQIDTDVNNYIRTLINTKIKFIEDTYRNRLLISFNNDIESMALSYNYKYNVFVSRHDYDTNIGYNTKSKIYLINNKTLTGIYEYSLINFNNYINSNKSTASIILNPNYENTKILEYIKYKLNKITSINSVSFEHDNRERFYSGDLLRVKSEFCDTDFIDIKIEENNSNTVRNYNKPYNELGIWNYNFIRNNINNYPQDRSISDEHTRFYGNWFIIQFLFTPESTNNKCVELELINGNIVKNLT